MRVWLDPFMQNVLGDKTNKKTEMPMRKRGLMNEKERVVIYLKDITNKTHDYNLKYDLTKCIEILEGKENQETVELKGALEEAILEKEVLMREKCELTLELDLLKSRSDDSRE